MVCLWCGRMVGRAVVRSRDYQVLFFGWVDYCIFLPMVLRCASFARKSSAILQRHSNFGSTTQYNMNRKTFRFILAVLAERRRYNNTLYNISYYIQICGGKTRTELSDSLLRILSGQRREKNLRNKTSVGKKTRQEIWAGSMAHALKSPSYDSYTAGWSLPLLTKQVFQQRTAKSK